MLIDDRFRKYRKDLDMISFAEPTQYNLQGTPKYNPPEVVTGNDIPRPNFLGNPVGTLLDIANQKINVGVTSGDIYDDAVAAEAARVAALNTQAQTEANKNFESDKADTFGAVSYTHLTLPTNREV